MKVLLFFVIDLYLSIKCKLKFYLYGPYGLSQTIERMPLHLLIKYFKKYGACIGDNCIIDSGIKVHRPSNDIPFKNLNIGNHVYIGHNAIFDLTDQITIEDDVALGGNCQIWTHTGDFNQSLRDKNDYSEIISSVRIRKGTICYSGTIISPGVEIGERVRVYALSLVSKSIKSNEVWGGVPAKFIKTRE